MTDTPDWPTQPIEASWHHYVEEHLTCDEGEKMVTHPGNGSKPKQMLSTGSKGQAMLPTNCLTAHGDWSQFLNYQKQVLRAFVEQMYSPCLHFIRHHFLTIIVDLVAKRTSGHVPWLEIYNHQSNFIDQVEFMPIPTKPVHVGHWSASSTMAYSWASTAEPGQISGDEPDEAGDFILLCDPSKMHKSEIEACFKHWLSRQENGDIAFAFSHMLNACDNLLRLAL